MDMPIKDYIKRISYALEHAVAPEIESDYIRGQLLAAVFLIDQLTDRIDYKPALIKQDIDSSAETIKTIVNSCGQKAGEVPEEISAFLEELDKDDYEINLKFRERCEGILSLAIEYFFNSKDKLEPAEADDLNGAIIKKLMKTATRDIGMLKPSTSNKLIQRKEKT